MATKTSPIGIIDSGIGGFSVALKMQQQLPHENLLYFGRRGQQALRQSLRGGDSDHDPVHAPLYGGAGRKGPAGGLQHHLLSH